MEVIQCVHCKNKFRFALHSGDRSLCPWCHKDYKDKKDGTDQAPFTRRTKRGPAKSSAQGDDTLPVV